MIAVDIKHKKHCSGPIIGQGDDVCAGFTAGLWLASLRLLSIGVHTVKQVVVVSFDEQQLRCHTLGISLYC